jgi:sugar/nucleoside kinase (ribokinase family)
MSSSRKEEYVSIHIVGDAFADLFCYLDLEGDLPQSGGDSRLVSPIQTMAGGSAVNTTTHLSSLIRNFFHHASLDLDLKLTLHTCINPNDDHGKMLLDHAAKHNLRLVNCWQEDSDQATGHCVVIVTRDDRSFLTHQGCIQEFHPQHLDVATIVESNHHHHHQQHVHIHVAGYYNLVQFWNGTLKQTLKQIQTQRKLASKTTTISLVPQHDASGQWDGALLDLLPLLDFLILSQVEADGISKRRDDEEPIQKWATFFHAVSPCTCIIVTRGAQGAVALMRAAAAAAGEMLWNQSAVEVTAVVDPTGAGDAFAAAFLYGLWDWHYTNAQSCSTITNSITFCQKEAIQAGLYWGCAVATASVLTRGASVPPSPEQIQAFLRKTMCPKHILYSHVVGKGGD